MRTTRIAAALVALTVIAAAAPAQALQSAGEALAMAPPPDRAEEADQLLRQAEELFSKPKQWKRAVRLLEQSAEMRDASDAEAFTCLIYAGRIRAAIGDMTGARLALEKAAAHALARGDVANAAGAYIDAAHAAVEDRDARRAQMLVDKARLLAQSPLLSVDQRSLLRARIPV